MSRALPEPTHLRAGLEGVLDLPALAERRERLDALLADYQRTQSEGDRAVVVALVGATGAGKSTLLNALAGAALAPEGVDRPTSREAVVYAPTDADVEALREARARIERYRVQPGAPWTGQVLVDTPDLNSVEPLHREIARATLEKADVALLVLHRGSVAEASQAAFLGDFARRRRLALVLNFADQLGLDARSQLRSQAQRLLGAQWETAPESIPCFAISAREAKGGVDVTGDWAALVSWLQELGSMAAARSVRRSNGGAVLESLRRIVFPALDAVETSRVEAGDAMRLGMQEARALLIGDLRVRFEAGRGHLRDEARRLAAVRGLGPLATALRIVGVGSGGLAAGTLLLRGSLPLGLAVAGAGAAVEKWVRHTRARDAESRWTEAEDDDGGLGRAARLALGGARSAAQRKGLAFERLGLPGHDDVVEALRAARNTAWNHVVTHGLVEGVAGWWRWARVLLFAPFNLALFALGADVIYRVVRGYLEGAYLPAAYYLNVAALVGLWSALGAGLAAASLRGVVRAAEARGQRHFEESLAELEARWRQALEESRAPLERARRGLTEAG